MGNNGGWEFITVEERLRQLAVEIAFLENAHMQFELSILENRAGVALRLDELKEEMGALIDGKE